MERAVFTSVDVIEPVFYVVSILNLNSAGSIPVAPTCAPRLSTEGTDLTYSLTAGAERCKTGIFPFKNAFKSEQVPVDIQKTGVR